MPNTAVVYHSPNHPLHLPRASVPPSQLNQQHTAGNSGLDMRCERVSKTSQTQTSKAHTQRALSAALEDEVERLAPLGPRRHLGPVRVDLLPVVLAAASVEINLVDSEPTSSLPQVPNQPEHHDHRNGKPVHEEGLDVEGLDGVVELITSLAAVLRN
jgi:hypothetical protein